MTPDQAYRNNFKLIDWSVPIVTVTPQRARGARSSMPCPMLIRDAMDPVKSMHDGKLYESKSALYRSYREGGVRIVEDGEKPEYSRDKATKQDIADAFQKVKQGYKPQPEDDTIEAETAVVAEI